MSEDGNSGRVVLGVVTSVHGIKGQVKVKSFTDDPLDLGAYGPVFVGSENRQLEISSLREAGGVLIVSFAGVASRDAAEALKGAELAVDRAVLPEPADGAFYYSDLAGLAVRRNGKVVGKVLDVVNFGAGDLLDIHFDGRKTSQYIAFNQDAVPVVDIAGGFVEIVPPDWMFDE